MNQRPESEVDEWPKDPRVKLVYELLCDDTSPPAGEHWEGFLAERIVAALLPQTGDGWVLVPREPTEEMIRAARFAKLAPDYTANQADGLPIWDNMDCPRRTDTAEWEAVFPGITKPSAGFFHPSYEWPEWQEHLFRVAYRAMLSAAPSEGRPLPRPPEGDGVSVAESGGTASPKSESALGLEERDALDDLADYDQQLMDRDRE